MQFLHLVLCPSFIVYGSLNRICILLLCECCINVNYVEMVHSAFQVYSILLLSYLSLLLIFDTFVLKLPTKNLHSST